MKSGFILLSVLILTFVLASIMVFQLGVQMHGVRLWRAQWQRVQGFYLAEAAYATWQWDVQNNRLPVLRFDIQAGNLPIFLKDVYLNQARQIHTPHGTLLYYAAQDNRVLALGSPDTVVGSHSPKQMLYFDGEQLSQ